MNDTATLALRVAAVHQATPRLRLLRLQAPGGAPLPGWTAGAHLSLQVQLPDGRSDWRAYSLINLSPQPGATAAPRDYLIGVQREDAGRGGSRWVHQALAVGAAVQVRPPRNDFALEAGSGCVHLLAGGIGVTPLASMAAACRSAGRPVRLVYAGRSRADLGLRDELQALLGDDLRVHADDEAGGPPELGALLDGCAPQDDLYVCGPPALLDGAQAAAHERGWPADRLRYERFGAPPPTAGDRAFELALARSGRVLPVAADRSILDVLIDAGCEPLFDCRRGECGVCIADVVDGEPDHRDRVLSAQERQTSRQILTCVSRCKGPRLVLDL